MSDGPMSKETREAADRLIARYPQPRSALLPLLYLVQGEHGYMTAEGIAFCAEKLDLTKAEVQAVQTFYEMYERESVGDWLITVCTNFSCKVRGGKDIYERLVELNGGHRDEEHGVGVKHLECLGNCEDAPVVQVNYQNYKRCTIEAAEELLEACRRGTPPPATDGQTPPTFREASWRLSGAADDPVLHAAAVHGAQADVTSYEELPAERVLDAQKPIGAPGVRDAGPDTGDTSGVPDVAEEVEEAPVGRTSAGERLNRPVVDEAPAEDASREGAPAGEPAAGDEPPPMPDEDKGPYPGDLQGQWGKDQAKEAATGDRPQPRTEQPEADAPTGPSDREGEPERTGSAVDKTDGGRSEGRSRPEEDG